MGDTPLFVPYPVSPFLWLQSNSTQHFNGAILVNAFETEQLITIPRNIYIREIIIESLQALHYELYFWRNVAGVNPAAYDTDSYIGRVDLDLPTDGEQLLGAGKYYLDLELNASILYNNDDNVPANQNALICSLVNRGPIAKVVGAGGLVVIKIGYTPLI